MKVCLLYGGRKYYKPFGKMTNPRRKDARMAALAHEILHWVMERTNIKEDGLDYNKDNKELAVNVCMVLDLVRNHLEMNIFKFRFGGLKDQISPDYMGEDEDIDEAELEDEVGTDVVCKDVHLAEQIYGSTLVQKYFSIRKALIETFECEAQEKLKTLYQIKKERPKFVGGGIFPSHNIYEGIEYEENVPLTITERFLKQEEKFKKGEENIVGSDRIYFAKLAGGYEEQMRYIVKKFGNVPGQRGQSI